MSKKSILILLLFALPIIQNNSLSAQTINIYNNGRQIFPSPNFDEEPKSLFATTDTDPRINIASNSPALPIAIKGLKDLDAEQYLLAKEAFRRALRYDPNNQSLWKLYEDCIIRDFNRAKIDENRYSSVGETYKPNFAITRTDSYIELGTLYIVGTVKNISDTQKQKISLKARLFDKNKKEIRTGQGTLRSVYKVLRPNETSIFEIPIRNPPSNMESYRVEIASWED